MINAFRTQFISLCLLLSISYMFVGDKLRAGNFSSESLGSSLPNKWISFTPPNVDKKTQYKLVKADSSVVLRARSDGGATILATSCNVELTKYPILTWRWKISEIVGDGDVKTKRGDDSSARIYVTFDYDDISFWKRLKIKAIQSFTSKRIPTRAINYIWANKIARSTVLPNPYSSRVMVMALRSGKERAGTWVRERRNVLRDYRTIFGEDPPEVVGVGVMTDTDNTNSETTSYYGDIVFHQDEGSDDISER